MTATKGKTKNKQFVDQFEALKDIPHGIVSSVVNDFGQQGASSLWEQMFGNHGEKPQAKTAGDLAEGEELELKNLKKKEVNKKSGIEPGINYVSEIIHGEKRVEQKNQQDIEVKIQEIILELKRLVSSSQELKVQFKEVAQEQRIARVGKYHLSFFEWMLIVVNNARLKVEDAAAWLKAMTTKKRKQGYWQQFKKHGTSFGLSNERVVATQTG